MVQIPPLSAIGRYEADLNEVLQSREGLGRVLVGDAVASLVPNALTPCEWIHQWIASNEPRLRPDTVIFLQREWDEDMITSTIRMSDLTWTYQIEGTPFFIKS